jgi:hypothetical protein
MQVLCKCYAIPTFLPKMNVRFLRFWHYTKVSSCLLRSNRLSATTDYKNDCALTTANGIPFKLAKRLPAPSFSVPPVSKIKQALIRKRLKHNQNIHATPALEIDI